MVPDADFFLASRCLEEADDPGVDGGDGATEWNSGGEITEDRFLGGRVVIHQPAEGYRAAIDPVLLAASIPASDGELILDVGCGVGTAGLCLATRVSGARVRGIDLQRDLIELAGQNVRDNGMTGRVDFHFGDLLDPPRDLVAGGFHHVMANPPFVGQGKGNTSPHAGKAAASVEGEADLRAWVGFCGRMVRPKGSVTLIHRADRLDELLAAMSVGLGDLAVFPLWPGGDGKPAKRVLVRGRKGVSAPLRLLPGLVLHGPGGGYTEAAESVLRHGRPLAF